MPCDNECSLEFSLVLLKHLHTEVLGWDLLFRKISGSFLKEKLEGVKVDIKKSS